MTRCARARVQAPDHVQVPETGDGALPPSGATLGGLLSRNMAQAPDAARSEDRAQVDWLRLERDACGTDHLCIARAYAARIGQLHGSRVQGDERESDAAIPPGHYPPPGTCRVWHLDRPPSQQPPPTSRDVRVPPGAMLIRS
jgi:hypothetical protein